MHINALIVSVLLLLCLSPVSSGQMSVPPPSPDSSQLIADRIIQSEIPVLVDFWAAWCMPCRMLNPILEEVEKKYRNRVLFLKVNVDIHRALSAYFGINSIPAVFIINRKNVVQALPGVQPKERYIAALDAVLAMPSQPPDSTRTTTPEVN